MAVVKSFESVEVEDEALFSILSVSCATLTDKLVNKAGT